MLRHEVLEVKYIVLDFGGDPCALCAWKRGIAPEVVAHGPRQMDEIQLMTVESSLTESVHGGFLGITDQKGLIGEPREQSSDTPSRID
jgi:hypothetical protein